MMALFDFSAFPTLVTPRLQLRCLEQNDADSIRELYSSPEVLQYLNLPPTDTRQKALELINWFNRLFDRHEGLQWAIILRDEDRFIGSCGNIAWDRENRHIDIGYQILPSFWRQGYASEATHAMLRWSFDN